MFDKPSNGRSFKPYLYVYIICINMDQCNCVRTSVCVQLRGCELEELWLREIGIVLYPIGRDNDDEDICSHNRNKRTEIIPTLRKTNEFYVPQTGKRLPEIVRRELSG